MHVRRLTLASSIAWLKLKMSVVWGGQLRQPCTFEKLADLVSKLNIEVR